MSGLRIAIDVAAPLVDEPVRLHVRTADRSSPVRIVATSTDADGVAHSAWADYAPAPDGSVHPARQPPVAGTYAGSDPFGLWWSMRAAPDRAFARSLDPVPTVVEVTSGAGAQASASFERHRTGPGVTVRSVTQDGLVGRLFLPPRATSIAVVVLGGSEGGSSQGEQLAALLASRGIAALALAYFGAEGLPAELVAIPVEYVEAAVAWLLRLPEVRAERVGLVGTSRGAELALLVAAGCPSVGAVAAFSASVVVWAGVAAGPSRCAWTRRRRCVAYCSPAQVRAGPCDNGPVALRDGFERLLDDGSAAAAEIQLERIAGPVLLASGSDDELWPSVRFGELGLRRLQASGRRPHDDRHDVHEGAGHAFARPPGLPPGPTSTVHRFDGGRYALGGSAPANARAAAAAWPRALAFLRAALSPP